MLFTAWTIGCVLAGGVFHSPITKFKEKVLNAAKAALETYQR